MVFTWYCYQTEPTLDTNCGVTLATSSSYPWLANCNAKDTSPGTVSRVWVVVSDSTGVRSSIAEVYIRGLNAGAPVVAAESVTATYVNPTEKIKITATITTAALATAVWSINSDSGVDLQDSALTPISSFLGSGTSSLNLALTPSSLSEGSTYTFTLLVSMASGNETGQASVAVQTNSPPLPGVLTVSPSSGEELTTDFTLSASLWIDDDIPLTYAIYYNDPRSGEPQTVQTRSETAYGESQMPAGMDYNNYTITCGVFVYDILDAYGSGTNIVTVRESTLTLAEKQEIVKGVRYWRYDPR